MTATERAHLEAHLACAILTDRPSASPTWAIDTADVLVARMVRDAEVIRWRRRFASGDARALSVGTGGVPS